ncbi:MAG TPA: mercuric reductase [Gemmatimonadales bacterium]|nr:mercuric reductase [Gemmatimonadales bacterium]
MTPAAPTHSAAGTVAAEAGPVRVEPFDRYNRALVANAHPDGWVNPEPRVRYHLVVIGAGTGGLVSASIAAGLGARVALIERHLMGGDCLNVGCVPSKAVIRAARSWADARASAAEFGGPAAAGAGDFDRAMERMRRLRAGISPIDGAPRYRELGVDVFLGDARFTGSDSIEVGGRTLRFRRAIVATGARATTPRVPGLAEVGYLTNETVFTLTELPARLVVIGAGPIGCELAQAFARFGSRVTVVNNSAHALPREDMDAARIVEHAMERDGVIFIHEAKSLAAERIGADRVVVVERGGREERIAGDQILIAVGRAANVEGLGLDAAGVRYGPKGVVVDDRLRTSNRRIYAVGDVASKYQFTHAADFLARTAVRNALFFGRAKASALLVPWCTYTSPEIAHVGIYERDAREAGREIETLTIPLEEVDRAVLDGETEGFFRVHLAKGSDRILGATLVAEHAGDMISEITAAMVNGVGLGGIGNAIHPYPTQAEVFRKAADTWRRGKLTPRMRRLFARYFRLLG